MIATVSLDESFGVPIDTPEKADDGDVKKDREGCVANVKSYRHSEADAA